MPMDGDGGPSQCATLMPIAAAAVEPDCQVSMHRNRLLAFLHGVVAVIACCCASPAIAYKPVAPLDVPSGAWLGGSEGNSEYFRLELDANGHGTLAVQYLVSEKAQAYRVLSTSMSGYRISFKLEPIDEAEPISLQGTANMAGMQLTVAGTSNNWSRKVLLENETNVLSRIDAVTRRARELRAVAPEH